MPRPITRLRTGQEDVDRALAPIVAKINEIVDLPLINGNIVEADLVQGVTNKINHGLGRPMQGWFVVKLPLADGDSWIYEIRGADRSEQLWLQSDGFGETITVKVYVF